MKVTLEVELKPCPFCGGEAILAQQEYSLGYHFLVCCSQCGFEQHVYTSQAEAVADWNKRVDDYLQLKPCPFCGRNVELISSHEGLGVRDIYVRCASCGEQRRLLYKTHEEAIDAWNRRVNP
ncbi:MAG: Lar family restriction alleviation protein [Synergistaceae bacterium]|nr:Lar family restriction alleviation protein [Synergistaceae bacterium]